MTRESNKSVRPIASSRGRNSVTCLRVDFTMNINCFLIIVNHFLFNEYEGKGGCRDESNFRLAGSCNVKVLKL